MMTGVLTKQFIVDASGMPIGVILPIEDYEALIETKPQRVIKKSQTSRSPLYGALRHLGGAVASTEDIDASLREMWSTWDDGNP